MSDGMLELWLRLLALHLPDPTDSDEDRAIHEIRNQWLLASRGYFSGCVPHGMEAACVTREGRLAVRTAVDSLLAALKHASVPLEADTLNLLGLEGWFASVDRTRLRDIGHAFLDLLDGEITGTASSSDVMPGSTSYTRRPANRQT